MLNSSQVVFEFSKMTFLNVGGLKLVLSLIKCMDVPSLSL